MFTYNKISCTTIHRYPIFSTRYSVMCKVYTGYCGTSEIEHGLCACTVDNPLAKARGLSLRTGAQAMLYLSHKRPCILRNVGNYVKLTKSFFFNEYVFGCRKHNGSEKLPCPVSIMYQYAFIDKK